METYPGTSQDGLHYAVFAEREPVHLAIKAVYEPRDYGYFIGVRFRSALAKKGLNVTDKGVLTFAWSDIEFTKANTLRASLVLGDNFKKGDLKKGITQILEQKGFFTMLSEWVKHHVPEKDRLVPVEEVVTFIREEFNAIPAKQKSIAKSIAKSKKAGPLKLSSLGSKLGDLAEELNVAGVKKTIH